MEKSTLENMRQNYMLKSLNEDDLATNPFDQFKTWLHEAVDSQLHEPNAMTIATVNANGNPSARVVLLKGITEKGITFYTNFKSRKGKELANNPNCAVVFLWGGLERQVRIEGQVNQLLYEESEEYYHSRPFESRISAYVSPQSEVIKDKTQLEKQWDELNLKYKDSQDIPMPEHWGGYEIVCNTFEFWQGRPSRFHDRFLYTQENQSWKIERLAP